MDVVGLIKHYKKEHKLNSEQLSKKSGVPLGTLTKILSGATSEPKFSTVVALAKALNCPAEAFFDLETVDLGKVELLNIYNRLDERGKQVLVSVAKSEYRSCNQNKDKFLMAARKGSKEEFCGFIDDNILSSKSEGEI
jgi:transcriptional regulator with XRE-family HTH domain